MGLRIEGLRSTDYTDYAERGQLMVNRYLLFVKGYEEGKRAWLGQLMVICYLLFVICYRGNVKLVNNKSL